MKLKVKLENVTQYEYFLPEKYLVVEYEMEDSTDISITSNNTNTDTVNTNINTANTTNTTNITREGANWDTIKELAGNEEDTSCRELAKALLELLDEATNTNISLIRLSEKVDGKI